MIQTILGLYVAIQTNDMVGGVIYFCRLNLDSRGHELSENVWVEGSLRPDYDKSGFENENRLLVRGEEGGGNTRDRSVPDGSDNNPPQPYPAPNPG